MQAFQRFFLHFNFVKNIKLIEVYLNLILTSFSFSLVGLFIPIYLLKEIGKSFDAVMLFLILYGLFTLLGFYIALNLSKYAGLNVTVMLSVPIRLAFLLMLNALKNYNISLILIAFIGGIGAPMFWLPFHKRFSQFSDHGKRGAELGLMYAANGFFAIIAPLFGGVVAQTFGFKWLYALAGIILGLSVVPLLFIKNEKLEKQIYIKDILKGRTYRELLGYFAEGYRINAYVLWMIFVFFIISSYVTIGGLSSVVVLFNTLFNMVVGYFSDVWDKKKILRIGALTDAITWILRVIFTSIYSIFALTSISGMAISVWHTPFMMKYYDKIVKKDGLLQLLFREIGLVLGKTLLFLLAMIFGMEFALVSVGFVLLFTMIYE
ncbi:MFS transporter [Candidatus Woesearchaeota archaeon]|nr:MAG: MFS transporter [Candidatus Woesearchaeota archaeon]